MRKPGAIELTTVDGGRVGISVFDITSWGEDGGTVKVYVRHEAEPWDVREPFDYVTSLITGATLQAFGAAQN